LNDTAVQSQTAQLGLAAVLALPHLLLVLCDRQILVGGLDEGLLSHLSSCLDGKGGVCDNLATGHIFVLSLKQALPPAARR
jgi:hypothetical protein